jgi:hypothetical protein
MLLVNDPRLQFGNEAIEKAARVYEIERAYKDAE